MTQSQELQAAAARNQQALDLRKAGVGYQREAKAATDQTLNQAQLETAEQLRAMERERLDAMFTPLYEKVLKKGPDAPRAAEIALKIMDRRSALLGLDTKLDSEQDRDITVARPNTWLPNPETLADQFMSIIQDEYDAPETS